MPVLTLWTGLGMKPLPPGRWRIPGWEIRWLEPEPPRPDEQPEHWIARHFERIPSDTSLLGGFSLGAQLALKHRELAPDRFPSLLLLSGFTDRSQWHLLLRILRFSRLPRLFLLLPGPVLLLIMRLFLLLLPAAERKRFRTVLLLWPAEAWRKVLLFLLDFKVRPAASILQICGARDLLLRPQFPAIRLPGSGHFLLPSAAEEVTAHLLEWWNERQKTG